MFPPFSITNGKNKIGPSKYEAMFTSDVYINRRKVLKQNVGSGLIILPGNDYSPMNYKDNCYPFRQDSTFLYYFGINIEGLTAIIDVDNDEEVLFGDDVTLDQIIWTGPLPSIREWADRSGVAKTQASTSVNDYVQKCVRQQQTIHWLKPYREANLFKLSQWLGKNTDDVLNNYSKKLSKRIVQQRVIKEPREIAELDQAVTLSNKMHESVMRYCKPGMMEYELVAHLESVAAAHNARMAYPTILTINGQTLHNHHHGNKITEGKMVLCDAGVEIESVYCGDITRTFPAGKTFTTIQRDVYNIVLAALNDAAASVKPGVAFKDVHTKACTVLAKGLTELGLMKGNPAEAVEAGAHALFFQCGLGHMIGLDVHDMEDIGEELVGYSDEIKRSTQFGTRNLRLGRQLETGFALTIEPGIYIIPEQISQWKAEGRHSSFINYDVVEKFSNFGGIRIEDNFIIEPHGGRQLGNKLAKTVEEIESLRSL